MRRSLLMGVVHTIAIIIISNHALAVSFTPLGELPDDGIVNSPAYGVSADAAVVDGVSGSKAFHWTSGGCEAGLVDFSGGSFTDKAYRNARRAKEFGSCRR